MSMERFSVLCGANAGDLHRLKLCVVREVCSASLFERLYGPITNPLLEFKECMVYRISIFQLVLQAFCARSQEISRSVKVTCRRCQGANVVR